MFYADAVSNYGAGHRGTRDHQKPVRGQWHCLLIQDEHVSSLYPGVFELCCQVMVEETEWQRATTLISRLRLPIREVAPSS